MENKQSGNWFLVDDDSYQWVKQCSETEYSLVEMSRVTPSGNSQELFEVYMDTLDMQDYFDSMSDELTQILDGFGYTGVDAVKGQYGNKANQVMAECIFEHYGSFQATSLCKGTIDACRKYIDNYVGHTKQSEVNSIEQEDSKHHAKLDPENRGLDELVMQLSHYAGTLEERGVIKFSDWDDLTKALNDVINTYYDGDNGNDIWPIAERIYLERFETKK